MRCFKKNYYSYLFVMLDELNCYKNTLYKDPINKSRDAPGQFRLGEGASRNKVTNYTTKLYA